MNLQRIESKITTIRGQKAILDNDVAELYGVETKRVNEAVSNHPEKFPEGYILYLTTDEWSNLKSKISTSNWGGKHKLPKAFSEKGLYMVSTILKSPKATETTLDIIETFAKVRELSRTIAELHKHDEEKQKSMLQKSSEIISNIINPTLEVTDTETTVKFNLAVLSIEHTAKRTSKKE
ncbi:MAG: hypothetical protein EZS26_000793 [Candidatus Ordinivivax streblomastigis]|uniref:KilA-N DNA-binding domain-containing protein n=1 Tax=Candidatus Ordinivivax streblomastigis TaxID=2540710 RepID=A0A5M8P4N7_9BACT|nr:MAG: hypothetical protein EZS26_000793 [Candidatus Ordinivivax streblomastigis]